MRYRIIFHCDFTLESRMRSYSRHLVDNLRPYYRKSKVPSYEPMNIKFSHSLYTQILELNIMMKRKCLGWKLISQKGCTFIQKVVRFQGNMIHCGFRTSLCARVHGYIRNVPYIYVLEYMCVNWVDSRWLVINHPTIVE